MLAIKFAPPHHVFLQQGYQTETMDGVLTTTNKANTMHTMKITIKDALYRLIYYSKSALHVSGDVFAHHQEHLTVFTASGSVHTSCCRLPAL